MKDNEVPRLIWADNLNPEDIDLLREQVDMALQDLNFPIVTNYEVHVEGIDIIERVEIKVQPCIRLTRFQILKKED